jgi:hypothetical protein
MDLQTPPSQLHFSFAPPSVSYKLHILTVPSTHFHTKLNGFQQLAYLLVTMCEILSNIVLFEIGFKNEKLQKFYVSQQEIVALWWPMISTFHTTELAMQMPYLYTLNYTPTTNRNFQYTYPRNMGTSNVCKPVNSFYPN